MQEEDVRFNRTDQNNQLTKVSDDYTVSSLDSVGRTFTEGSCATSSHWTQDSLASPTLVGWTNNFLIPGYFLDGSHDPTRCL